MSTFPEEAQYWTDDADGDPAIAVREQPSPHRYERGPYAVDGAQVCGICGGRRAASVHRGYDPDGFLRLKGTATGDNQLDPEPTPCPKQSAHEAHTHSGFARPDGVPPAQCPGVPEPLQADASPLLDLVQQYGAESYEQGVAAGQRDEGAEDHYDDKARALLARIAALVQREEADALQTITDRDLYHEWADKLAEGIAEHTGADIGEHSNVNNPWRVALESLDVLVPQQPVQARDRDGEPLWIHVCGKVVGWKSDVPPPDWVCDDDTGRWRPLLVGGDPAPERCTAISGLHGTRCIYLVQDERHEANDDDRTRHEDENGFVWIAVRSGGDRAPEVDGQRLDAQRAWLHRELLAITAQRDEYASKLGEAHADLDEARAEVERLSDERDKALNWRDQMQENGEAWQREAERLKADVKVFTDVFGAKPDPLVLSLAALEPPPGTVALVGRSTRVRYVREATSPVTWRIPGDRDALTLLEVFQDSGPELEVELAPPREPRTWPKLDGAPDGVEAVRGASGMVYRLRSGQWHAEDDSALCDSLPSVQNYDGPLTEVTE